MWYDANQRKNYKKRHTGNVCKSAAELWRDKAAHHIRQNAGDGGTVLPPFIRRRRSGWLFNSQ